MSNNYNFNIDDDDDVFIQPDVQQKSTSTSYVPPQSTVHETQQGSSSQNNENTGFFNFTNFVNPQQYFNPILENNNIQVKERQFTGGNTLDESVVTTLHRDLSKIGDKLLSILWPLRLRQKLIVVERVSTRFSNVTNNIWRGDNSENGRPDAGIEEDTIESDLNHASGLSNEDYSKDTIKKILDWDLWGPLIITLSFSLVITYLQTRSLNLASSENQQHSSEIFSASFTLIWGALAVLSLNIQLTSPVQQKTENGGLTSGIIGLSLFQCVSILSYTMFPILIGGTVSIFIKWKLIRMVINLAMLFWSMLCSWLIFAIINNCKTQGTPTFIYGSEQDEEATDGDKRLFLMVYPIFLVFGLFSWLCVIV